MKVFLPIKIKPTGGSSRFALKLQASLRPKGHKVVFRWQSNFDLLLVNATCPLRFLLYAKIKGKPIIQRLDGVYYPSTVAGWKYRLYNFPLQVINLFFANHVIYQSLYSKYCCNIFLGKNRYISSSMIYNGVDIKKFSNHGDQISLRDSDDQHLFITTARWRRQDQIYPIIKSFKIYKRKWHNNSKLVILGNFEGVVEKLPSDYKDDSSLAFLGTVKNEELPQYLRAADVFLFTHLNPPCPNNIIEAMACGLPICGVSDGAMREITKSGYNSELLAVESDSFYSFRQFDHDMFAGNISKIMKNKKEYAQNSRLRVSKSFTLRQMIDKYLEVFIKYT